MKAGRVIALGIALVAGAGVFFLMANDGDVEQPIAQVIPRQDPVDMVRVLVADKEFARGERLDQAETKWVSWPKKALQDYMITEENQEFYDELGSALARNAIAFGEPITQGKIVLPGSRGMMSALLTPGMRAVTMDVSTRQSAGGFILPGDRIDLFASFTPEGKDEVTTKMLYPNVRVLAIDQTYNQGESASKVGRTVTMELAPSQVENFLSMREDATLSLVLRSIFQPEEGETLLQEVAPASVVVVRYGRS